MNIGYIDTSFLLSLIFEDENYEKSIDQWNKLEILFSSILIEIESRINIYKYCIGKKNNEELYKGKLDQLGNYLENIYKKIIDNEILLEIKNVDKLKRPRSLDSIHLATANILNKLSDDRILLCSYDKNMRKIGKELGITIQN